MQLGTGKMTLSAKSDKVTYLVDFAKDGHYALQMTSYKKHAGKTITVSITCPWRGNILFSFTESIILGGGKLGFYTTGQSMSYKNLTITGQ